MFFHSLMFLEDRIAKKLLAFELSFMDIIIINFGVQQVMKACCSWTGQARVGSVPNVLQPNILSHNSTKVCKVTNHDNEYITQSERTGMLHTETTGKLGLTSVNLVSQSVSDRTNLMNEALQYLVKAMLNELLNFQEPGSSILKESNIGETGNR